MNDSATSPSSDDDLEQPFISHLMELRERLLRMILAIAVAFVVLFPFANEIYTLVAAPIRAHLPEGASMIATQVASPFLTPFKLALVAAVFVAMPYLLYQFWAFVAPGLYRHEKRLAIPLLASSIVLFYLGMLFAYVVVFPLVFRFFAAVTPAGVQQMPDIAFYLEFVLKLFFAFGLAFEIPVATILLVAVGATTPQALADKRPYVIVGVFVAGMLLTPPDVISQTLLALPMWLLFELGIVLSRFFQRQLPAEEEHEDGEGDPSARSAPVGETLIGAELAPKQLTEEEMDAELDRIEAEEDLAEELPPNSIAEYLRQAHHLRAAGNLVAARKWLYRVLEEGDAHQRRVARHILDDIDD